MKTQAATYFSFSDIAKLVSVLSDTVSLHLAAY